MDLGEENKVSGAFGGVEFGPTNTTENAGTIKQDNLPVQQGFWSRVKSFWLQNIEWNKEIVVELTPGQQKVEDEINDFLHQDVTWEKVHDFLFQEITF